MDRIWLRRIAEPKLFVLWQFGEVRFVGWRSVEFGMDRNGILDQGSRTTMQRGFRSTQGAGNLAAVGSELKPNMNQSKTSVFAPWQCRK